MYNIQADSYWKGTLVFDKNYILDQNDKSPDDDLAQIWSARDLPLIECKDEEKLDLSIWTQILQIKYAPDQKQHVQDYYMDIKNA